MTSQLPAKQPPNPLADAPGRPSRRVTRQDAAGGRSLAGARVSPVSGASERPA